MATIRSRREFLAAVGQGMLVATVGSSMAIDLGLASARAAEGSDSLSFGPLEPLVALMQETPIDRLLPTLVERIRCGTELRQLVSAAALANARTFGGEDYIGFHTMMAIGPSFYMAQELPTERQPLPVFKVLYRNTNRIHDHGGRASEVLHPVTADTVSAGEGAQTLRAAVHAKDVNRAERTLAGLAQASPEEAFNDLLMTVQDQTEVHRVVLPYRAWDLLGLIGRDHAHTMLRQSVRYCVNAENGRDSSMSASQKLLAELLDRHHLMDRSPGTRQADDAWIEQMSQTIFNSSATDAGAAVAAALAEGFAPADLGEAISLAANQLILRDVGRPPRDESPGKPPGSVHGDSIGVHACDSANAWRNMARAGNTRNTYACLILGAYQVALDRVNRGGDFLHWNPLPLTQHVDRLNTTDPSELLRQTDEAIRGNLQGTAAAAVYRYGQLGHDPRQVFDLMLKYAISEDGALHAEKYYRTVSEEFAATRPAFRWRQLTALARVTASECGRPAAGYREACELLKVS